MKFYLIGYVGAMPVLKSPGQAHSVAIMVMVKGVQLRPCTLLTRGTVV